MIPELFEVDHDVDETAYWIVLPVIAIWALWGLVALARGAGSEAIRKSTN